MFRRTVIAAALGALALCGTAEARRPGLQVGNLWWGPDGDGIRIYWPGGQEESGTNPDITQHIGYGTISTTFLISNFKVPASYFAADPGALGTTIAKFVNDGQDDLADNSSSFFLGAPDVPGPKYFRVAPPTVTQDGKALLDPWWQIGGSFNVQDAVKADLGSDAAIDDQAASNTGILERNQRYAWSSPDYEDIIFEVNTYTYPTTPIVPDLRAGERGSAPSPETASANPVHNGLYLGTHWFIQNADRGPSGGAHITVEPGQSSRWLDAGLGNVGLWDEINTYDETLFNGSARLFYSRDGDAADASGYRTDGDDRGEPAPGQGEVLDRVQEALISEGEFMESYYKGRVVLFVSKNPVADVNTLSAYDDSNNWLTESGTESTQPYLSKRGLDAEWTSTSNSSEQTVYDWHLPAGTTRAARIEPSDLDKPGFTNPSRKHFEWLSVWGPWDLPLGQGIQIVSALFVKGPSPAENKRVGRQWVRGEISFAEKEAFLDSGYDSMMVAVGKAKEVWDNRKAISGWGVVPVGPVAPAYPATFNVSSGPDQNILSWSASSEADFYRIYRVEGFATRPKQLIADNVTGTSYTDVNVVRGTRYYYSVTSVKNSGLESSYWATRTEGAGVSPFRAPESTLNDIRVVPNPFQIRGGDLSSGGYNFPGQPNKLLFVNLPSECIIRIFTVTGDLVNEILHNSGSGDESWDLMTNDNNQFLVSGIYLAHITSLDPAVPGTHIEKFVVVR